MIMYTTDVECVNEEMLHGFFVGWSNPPTTLTHLHILKSSCLVWLAIDKSSNKVVGFVYAISDGILSAYIPLIEVLPEYQKTGIGKELMTRILESLKHLYMVDLLCDEDMQVYYAKFGMKNATGSLLRNYDRQSGV